MLQQTRALHTQTEPLSAMSNGSTNAQIEPGYQHTTFPSSYLSAAHDRQERQGVPLIYYNGLRPGVHCYQLPLPWWCWTRRWNGANYHLYLPIQHYTLWGAYLHRFCCTCTLLFATSPDITQILLMNRHSHHLQGFPALYWIGPECLEVCLLKFKMCDSDLLFSNTNIPPSSPSIYPRYCRGNEALWTHTEPLTT